MLPGQIERRTHDYQRQGTTSVFAALMYRKINALQPRLSGVRRRIDQAYQDKLDGKIPEDFWERKMAEWTIEDGAIREALIRLEQPTSERLLTAQRTLELANKAYSLYLTRSPQEQAHLLRMVLLNCAIDGATVQPTYRKPFDLIFARAKDEDWSGRAFEPPTPLVPNHEQGKI
jgi:site-specific DNA recombinase